MAKRLVLARCQYVNPKEYLSVNTEPGICSYAVQMIDRSTPPIVREIAEHLYQSIISFGYVNTVPTIDNGICIQALRVVRPECIDELDASLSVVMGEYVKICDELEKIRLRHLGSESHNGICEGANKVLTLKNELGEVIKMVELYNTLSKTDSEDNGYYYRLSLE